MATPLKDGKIYRISAYHPWRDGSNPNFDSFSRRILDIKDPSKPGYFNSVRWFSREFTTRLSKHLSGEGVEIIVAPSHSEGKTSKALEEIAHYAQQNIREVQFLEGVLRRAKTIEKLSSGGNRSIQIHLDSIEVYGYKPSEKPVLILDDVTTTKNTLKACRQILRNAHAHSIYCVALGETES